jgi:hypothetical protein
MTIDELGRAAGERLRDDTAAEVDVRKSLDDLIRGTRRRRQLRFTGAAVAAAAAAAVVALAMRGELPALRSDGPTTPTPTISQSSDVCGLAFVTCADNRPYVTRIEMRVPIVIHVPENFDLTPSSFVIDHCCERPAAVEVVRRDATGSSASGVTVLEDVQAAAADQRAGPDTSVPLTARSLASWLARRPDLETSDVSRGTTAGLPSWTVTVRVADPQRQPAGSCLSKRVNCTPMLYLGELADDPLAGMWGDMVGRFSFVKLPENDAAVIWSWAFGDDSLLDRNNGLIDSIRFDTSGA